MGQNDRKGRLLCVFILEECRAYKSQNAGLTFSLERLKARKINTGESRLTNDRGTFGKTLKFRLSSGPNVPFTNRVELHLVNLNN